MKNWEALQADFEKGYLKNMLTKHYMFKGYEVTDYQEEWINNYTRKKVTQLDCKFGTQDISLKVIEIESGRHSEFTVEKYDFKTDEYYTLSVWEHIFS